MVVSCIHQQLLKPTTTSFSVACSFTDTSSSSSHSHSSLSHINGRLRSHLVTARDDRISVWEVRGGGQRDGNSRQQQRREGKEEEEREDGEQAQVSTCCFSIKRATLGEKYLYSGWNPMRSSVPLLRLMELQSRLELCYLLETLSSCTG